MYYKILKQIDKKKTLQSIADSVGKNHATVLHSLNNYDTFEQFNPTLKLFRKEILSRLNYKSFENIVDSSKDEKITALQIEAIKQSEEILELKEITEIENESPLGILKARMAQVGDVFDLVTSVPQIKAQFYARSKTVQISYLNETNKTVDVYNMQIPLSSFKSSYFNTKVSGDKVSIQLNPEIEAKILSNTVPGILNIDDKLEDFSAQFSKISSRSFTPTSSGFTSSEYIGVAESKVAKGKISLREKAKKWTRIRRITTGKEIIQEPKRTSMNAFISSKFLTTEVMKEMSKRMPHGPIGGYPLAKTILTYRTGRFVNSLRMFIDYRTNMVQYYYNPMYYVHETTTRDPKRLIESSTRTILSSFFTRQFKILKGA